MSNRTIQQIIDDIIEGRSIDQEESTVTILALHSMLTRSRMNIETIASHIGNIHNTHTAARCLFGNLDHVRQERELWMESDPEIWLKVNHIKYIPDEKK